MTPIDPSTEYLSGTTMVTATPVVRSSVWRHPWFIALAGAATVCVFALVAVTFALWSASSARNDLQRELSCRTESAVVVDAAKAEQLAAIGITLASIQDGLAAVATGDDAALVAATDQFPANRQRLLDTAAAVDVAVNERRLSIETC
jgi:hypothetical protein